MSELTDEIEALIYKEVRRQTKLFMENAKIAYTNQFEQAIGEDEAEDAREGMPDRAFEDGYTAGANQLRAEARKRWNEA